MATNSLSIDSWCKDDKLLAILSGSNSFKNKDGRSIKMPDLSCLAIQYLGNQFGLRVYPRDEGRWQSIGKLLSYCQKQQKLSELFAVLFSKSQFKNQPLESGQDTESMYQQIREGAIWGINNRLCLYDLELLRLGNTYKIVSINTKSSLLIPAIEDFDQSRIAELRDLALKCIQDGDLDSAVTKSRTILEEAMLFVLKEQGVEHQCKGNINSLYKEVQKCLNMSTDKALNKNINTLISGLSTIVNALAEMRNRCGDAHGHGENRVNVLDYHVLLALNSSITVSEFLFAASKRKTEKDQQLIKDQ